MWTGHLQADQCTVKRQGKPNFNTPSSRHNKCAGCNGLFYFFKKTIKSKKFAIGTINLLRKCNFSLYIWQKIWRNHQSKNTKCEFWHLCILLPRKLTFIIYISKNNNAYNLQNTRILHTILVLIWYHFESNTTV